MCVVHGVKYGGGSGAGDTGALQWFYLKKKEAQT